ncbi:MAG: helix-turn-helix transcriptional regulator [Lachnospiraceae bacterium]|nr:helix-turn-helix transcriptional regulator [Lachnospiraceae bacterium]
MKEDSLSRDKIAGINPIDIFSRRLDIMMNALGVSINELERRTGLSRNTIAQAKSGKTHVRSDTMVTIVNGLGVSMDQFYGWANVGISKEGEMFLAMIEKEDTAAKRNTQLRRMKDLYEMAYRLTDDSYYDEE